MNQNWLVGNSVSLNQWESGNSGSAFPFEDDSLPDGLHPGCIVDACLCIPSGIGGMPTLSCFHSGPGLVSAMVTLDGLPALYCAVTAGEFSAFEPVRLSSSVPNVSGMLTFGDVSFAEPYTWRGSAAFSESAVVRHTIGRLEGFYRPSSGLRATGFVGLDLPEGVTASVSEDGHSSVVRFSCDADVKESVLSPCAKYERPVSMPVPIRSINGVGPDEKGRIAIVFTRGGGAE